MTVEIGGWQPVQRLNLTGGEKGVNPSASRPARRGLRQRRSPGTSSSWSSGPASLWAMNRMRDSRLGRAWMAIREDETAADCMGVDPIKTKLLAFALGASFSGFAGSFYAAKLQAITPGAFEFNVSIILLCMVVLGGMGSLKGVILGGMLITLFDRILLAQMTHLVRWVGARRASPCSPRWTCALALVLLRAGPGARHALQARGARRAARSGRWRWTSTDGGAVSWPPPRRSRAPRPSPVAPRRRAVARRGRPAPPRGPRRDQGLRRPGRGQRGGSRHRRSIVGLIGPNGAGRQRLQRRSPGCSAGPRRDPLRRPADRRLAPQRHRGARHRPDVPVHPALPEHDGPRQHPGRRALSALGVGGRGDLPAARVPAEERARGTGRGSCSSSSASGEGQELAKNLPTATSAGWRSPAPWPPSRSCCSSTSRRPG